MTTSKKTPVFFRHPLNGAWEFRRQSRGDWRPATVPGCNVTDLLANGEIPDPFYRDSEAALQWIGKAGWEYRRFFSVDEDQLAHTHIDLVAEGLDTFCDILLNGHRIGGGDNMFVGWRIACKSHLRVGNNLLEIRFRSPLKEVLPQYRRAGFAYPAENDKSREKLSVYCRKAPHHFGWDWSPRFVTSGIWRDIYLEFRDRVRIDNVSFHQDSLSELLAEFSFRLEIEHCGGFSGELQVTCDEAPELNSRQALHLKSPRDAEDIHCVELDFALSSPRRWWPNGLGEAFLYHFRFELIAAEGPLARVDQAIGLRTVEVINKPDAMGESFYIEVNGHPVFMKGANYIPGDSFPHRVTADRHRQLIDAAVDANMNMLRVWGGGIYQDDLFYRLADEKGILVWQDFMFACSLYPADKAFLQNVRREAQYNVRRLRNHPCIALWCGNNEIEMGIAHWHWPEKFGYSEILFEQLQRDYMRLFDECLPAVLKIEDPGRFYLRSSPTGFWERGEDHKGNHHYWGVWHGEEPFSEYQRRIPRFMSEFGFQSFPISASVVRYTEPADRHLESRVMRAHQKHPRGNRIIRRYMDSEFNPPKDFASLLYLSQVQQALGLKLAFEAHRAAMPFCMGTLYWQFNDSWPAASWSGIDYYGRWKALHYQAKRCFEPQLIVVAQDRARLKITLISDSLQPLSTDLELTAISFDGRQLWSHQLPVELAPNSGQQVFEALASELLAGEDPAQVVLAARLRDRGSGVYLAENTHFFLCNRKLALMPAHIEVTRRIDLGKLTLTLNTDRVVRQLYLDIAGVDQSFSDNFFDLIPGRAKTLHLSLPDAGREMIAGLADRLTWFSLVDSYNSHLDRELSPSVNME